MTYYAYNVGELVGFTKAEDGASAPAGAVMISDQEHAAAIHAVNFSGASAKVVGGKLVVTHRPAPTLSDIKMQALNSINGKFEDAVTALRSAYPDSEVLSWSKQEIEARAWSADPMTPTPMIDCLCAARGIQKPDMVGRILAKANDYTLAVGQLIGKRQRLEDLIEALTDNSTAQEFAAIVW